MYKRIIFTWVVVEMICFLGGGVGGVKGYGEELKVKLLKTLERHSNYVSSVAFSPDGKYLASGGWDNTIRLWEIPEGTLIKTLKGHTHYDVYSVAFSPNGKYLASGSGDNTIKLWELSPLQPPFLAVKAKFDDTSTDANGLLDSGKEAEGVYVWGIFLSYEQRIKNRKNKVEVKHVLS